jgi:rfaE bifunctional protein nucleotidyltransferase chain/domain
MKNLQNVNHKIIDSSVLSKVISSLKDEGKKIVFTNGCFDILHKGHVTYLALAADFGDVLVLGLNSDDSVRRQGKGDNRPVNDFDARATVAAALGFVDYVIEFDEDTPLRLIELVMPDVLVKGGDYNINNIIGREFAKETCTIKYLDGFSSTSIIKMLSDGKYILGSVPFGYKRENNKLVINDIDVEVLNLIWNCILDGKSL